MSKRTLTNIVKNTLLAAGLGTILGCVPVGKGDGIALLTNMNEGLDYVERRDANNIQRQRNDIYAQQQQTAPQAVIYMKSPEESREGKIETGPINMTGCKYNGQYIWREGLRVPHGKGVAVFNGRDLYDGDWADGKKNGRGKWIETDGKVWDGYWKEDKWIRAADTPKPEKTE